METFFTIVGLLAILGAGYYLYQKRSSRTKDRSGPDEPGRFGS